MRLKTIPALIICLTFFACGGNAEQPNSLDNENIADTVVVEEDGNGSFGKEISADGALNPTEFLAKMEGKDSLAVKIAANINACCKKKGCWMDLDLENGTTMKVRFKDYGFFVPLDSEGKNTIIEGMAYLEEVSEADRKHYAEDAGKTQEEIDAITGPKLAYTFIAEGALIQ
jgi:hypothetical protein